MAGGVDGALLNLHSHSERKIQRSSEAQMCSFHSAGSKVGLRLGHWDFSSLWKDVCCYHCATQRADPEMEAMSSEERSVDRVWAPQAREMGRKRSVWGIQTHAGHTVRLNSAFCSGVDFFCSSKCTPALTPRMLLHLAIRGEHEAHCWHAQTQYSPV